MRVFWPAKIKRDRGIAVGWTVDKDLIVVDIVTQWRDEYTSDPSDPNVPPLRQLANVLPAFPKKKDVKDTPENNLKPTKEETADCDVAADVDGAADGDAAVVPAPQVPDLTVWVHKRRPVACDQVIEVVMYSPPKRAKFERLGLGHRPVANGAAAELAKQEAYGIGAIKENNTNGVKTGENGAGPKDATPLAPILDLMNVANDEQSRISNINSRGKIISWANLARIRPIMKIMGLRGLYQLLIELPQQQRTWSLGLLPSSFSPLNGDMIHCRLPEGNRAFMTVLQSFMYPAGMVALCDVQPYGPPFVYDVWSKHPNLFWGFRILALSQFWFQLLSYVGTGLLYAKPFLVTVLGFLSHEVKVGRHTLSLRRVSAVVNHLACRIETLLASQTPDGKESYRGVSSTVSIKWDMIGGFTVAALLLPSLESFAIPTQLLVDPVIAALEWLNEWPLGLKLNTQLSQYLCSGFSSALTAWHDTVTPFLTPSVPYVLNALSIASIFGLSCALALVSDVVGLLTLHLRACYSITATLGRWQISALKGLWDLFRGKRWNVLRHRTDSHAYDIDTLFLGTLLFTLSTFLAPTVLAYGALFAVIHVIIVVVQRTLRITSAAIDTLPISSLKLRTIFPRRVPAGIVFDTLPTPETPAADAALSLSSLLEVKSTPQSYGTILGSWLRGAVTRSKGVPESLPASVVVDATKKNV